MIILLSFIENQLLLDRTSLMLILDTMINPSIEFNFTHYHNGEEASRFAQTS